MAHHGSWLKNGFLVVSSLFVSLLVVEVILRHLDPNGAYFNIRQIKVGPLIYRHDAYLHHVFRPDIDVLFESREYAVRVTTNSMGLRDYDGERLLAPEKKRVLFLGDSYVAGLRVDLHETAAKQLENLLNRGAAGEYVVVNAGASSYSPVLEYLQLKKLYPVFTPEVVVLGLFINDFGGDYELLHGPGARFGEDGVVIAVEGRETEPAGFLYRTFFLYHFVTETHRALKQSLADVLMRLGLKELFRPYYDVDRWEERPEIDVLQESVHNEEYVQATFRYLSLIKAYCDRHGVDFLLVIVPQPNQVGAGQVVPGWQCIWYSPVEYIESTHYQDLVLDFCSDEGISCLDLLPSFRSAHDRGMRLFFRRDGHWNPEGERLVAGEIHRFMMDHGMVRQ